MKKIFILATITSIGCVSPTFAANEFIPLTTVEQAQQYCPPINGLIFTKNNSSIPNGAGTITGNNHIAFESIPPKTAVYPKNIDASSFISDAQFRSADGIYGYLSNNVVTCLYSYTTFTNAQYALALRGK